MRPAEKTDEEPDPASQPRMPLQLTKRQYFLAPMPTAQLCLLLGKTKENESVMGECGTIIDKLDSADTWLVRALIGSG
ncbi:hypothetical protein KEM48_013890 [Puccinia striiformis f. sp. tritici PST-130]|nr:hypothetical protein KEM48_013890 [Puccinia striiformis f. sp. tritici PST-130]